MELSSGTEDPGLTTAQNFDDAFKFNAEIAMFFEIDF